VEPEGLADDLGRSLVLGREGVSGQDSGSGQGLDEAESLGYSLVEGMPDVEVDDVEPFLSESSVSVGELRFSVP
jgi:hypothetical protein